MDVVRQATSRCPPATHILAELPYLPSAVPQARRVLREGMRMAQLPEDVRSTAELLVSELVTNAVKYGQPPLWLLIEMRPGLIHASVSDTSTVLPQRRTAAPDAEGGRGLLVLDALAGSWGTVMAESGKYLWFDLPVPHEPAPAGDGEATATASRDGDRTPASAGTSDPTDSTRVAAGHPHQGRSDGPASPSTQPPSTPPPSTPPPDKAAPPAAPRAALVSSGLRADGPTATPAASTTSAISQRRSRPGSGRIRPAISGPGVPRSDDGQPDTRIITRLF
ncbi:anti-sigma regulatory factor (Ser/Thr protein kinase) [Frankia sp. CpI1-P]|nr:anti-sigma regulatory factor (Ser/Thr protein kinase) [Frankia sp. CpI1-P]KQM04080.1 anti-sigma regulatory factor (Ser/Thr protein kinase) [Frankia sp. CpI1-P]